jgi:hypothetical protein
MISKKQRRNAAKAFFNFYLAKNAKKEPRIINFKFLAPLREKKYKSLGSSACFSFLK